MDRFGEVIIEGATVAGRACALALARRGLSVTVLTDPGLEREAGPGFGYRSWWPQMSPGLYPFFARGVDLLEALWQESGAAFALDRRGDLWLGLDDAELELLRQAAGRAAQLGAGPLREHPTAEWYLPGPPRGLGGVPGGIDLIEGRAGLAVAFPSLSVVAAGGLHVRRAGTVDPACFGHWLDQAMRAERVTLVGDRVANVERGQVSHRLRLRSGRELSAVAVILATDRRVVELTRRTANWPGVHDWLRIAAAALGCRGIPPGAPALCLRRTDVDWAEIRGSDDGHFALGWTVPAIEAASLGDLAADLDRRITRHLPGIGVPGPAGFTTAVSRMSLSRDRRPILGSIEGPYLATAGHGGSIVSALAGAEALADYLVGGQFPEFARAVAAIPPGFSDSLIGRRASA